MLQNHVGDPSLPHGRLAQPSSSTGVDKGQWPSLCGTALHCQTGALADKLMNNCLPPNELAMNIPQRLMLKSQCETKKRPQIMAHGSFKPRQRPEPMDTVAIEGHIQSQFPAFWPWFQALALETQSVWQSVWALPLASGLAGDMELREILLLIWPGESHEHGDRDLACNEVAVEMEQRWTQEDIKQHSEMSNRPAQPSLVSPPRTTVGSSHLSSGVGFDFFIFSHIKLPGILSMGETERHTPLDTSSGSG